MEDLDESAAVKRLREISKAEAKTALAPVLAHLTALQREAFFATMFVYTFDNKLDAAFVAQGLILLGLRDVEMRIDKERPRHTGFVRFTLSAVNKHKYAVEPNQRLNQVCKKMVYFKVWTNVVEFNDPDGNDPVMVVSTIEGKADVYAGQTQDNLVRERSAAEKLRGYSQYICIGHNLEQLELDAMETALIFLSIKVKGHRNVSRLARYHYIRLLEENDGFQNYGRVPVNHGLFSWSKFAFVSTAPPLSGAHFPRTIELEGLADAHNALRLLLNLYGGMSRLTDHLKGCVSSSSKQFPGIEDADKLRKVEVNGQLAVEEVKDSQFVLHIGWNPTTIAHPAFSCESYIRDWVGYASVLAVDENATRHQIWIWTLHSGLEKYLKSPDSIFAMYEIQEVIINLADEFQQFHHFKLGESSEDLLSKDDLEEFLKEKWSDIGGKKLNDLKARFLLGWASEVTDLDQVEPESAGMHRIWPILRAYSNDLFNWHEIMTTPCERELMEGS